MERITRFRVHIMALLLLAVMGFYAFRMFKLQVIDTGGSRDNTTTFITETRVKASRGEILDTNGNVLVGNRASYDLVINNYVLLSTPDRNDYLFRLVELCRELGVTYNDHFPMTAERPFVYTLDKLNSSWQGYFQEYLSYMEIDSDISAPLLVEKLRSYYGIPSEWTDEQARAVIGIRYELSLRGIVQSLPLYVFMEDVSDDARSAILELNVPGMNVESSVVREYHTTYAAHILGTIGKMDAEQWEYYKNVDGYLMDAEIGQSGLEAAMEEYLHGVDGKRIDVVTADGTIIESYYETEPKAGNNVEITLDINLQKVAEDALANRIETLRNGKPGGDGTDVEGGAVVVMDPWTGKILACASYPTFDLVHYNEKYQQILDTPYNALYNRALNAAYPPGSTYKMSMIIAGIDSGTININTKIEDKGVFDKYEGLNLECLTYTNMGYTDGMVDARKALEVSCNYYFYVLGDEIPLSAMDSTAKNLGLGEPTGVELPEEVGHRANEETKKLLYGEDAGWYQGDQITAAIGQSDNRFTPLQLCVYASTLATKGTRYKATFLNRVVSSDYRELILENEPKVMSTFTISDEAYTAYSEGMYRVTSSGSGTAWQAFHQDGVEFPIQVAGKTGTADGTTGSANGGFVCYAPYDANDPKAPEIAIAVYGEKAGHGSSMAYVARDILEAYFATDKASEGAATYENELG